MLQSYPEEVEKNSKSTPVEKSYSRRAPKGIYIQLAFFVLFRIFDAFFAYFEALLHIPSPRIDHQLRIDVHVARIIIVPEDLSTLPQKVSRVFGTSLFAAN